ncbi:hypothetical protein CTI12_AA305880 [Artemisia annua]|uniref:ATPase, F1/V1/A1 complex, alpha/beta subunit, Zinc knuckle CX2CX4HX4C n=1 Tax=Artemisia annua TaxID=35608 RepID=A0A2U1N5B1_ARTAN|nr:hypothetical protein CTI12_AA305880 [Artemisia annua]
MVMDSMTAAMCYSGVGNVDYARVLVEIDAEKEIRNEIEVQYRDKENKVKGTKKVSVMYDWKPSRCTECKVFGHDFVHCKLNKATEVGMVTLAENVNLEKNDKEQSSMRSNVEVQAQKKQVTGNVHKQTGVNRSFTHPTRKQQEYRKKQNIEEVRKNGKADPSGSNGTNKKENKSADVGSFERQEKDDDNVNGKKYEEDFPALGSNEGRSKSQSITQKVNKNKFDVLGSGGNNETLDSNDNQKCQGEGDLCRGKNGKSVSMEGNIVKENEEVDIFTRWEKEEEMIDMFVNNKRNPTDEELETWARYMCEWYKKKWDAKWKCKCPIVGRSIWIID